MSEPILPLTAMEAEVRRAALALLPAQPNATLEQIPDAPLNSLGEPTEPVALTVMQLRFFLLDLREYAGRWTPAGIVDGGTQRALIAPASGETIAPTLGNIVRQGAIAWKIQRLEHLPVDDVAYWHVLLLKVRRP